MPATLPETLAMQTRDGPDRATFVGASLWGSIYRSTSGPEYYRVLQLDEAPPAAIGDVAQWVGTPPKKAIASILEVRHSLEVDLTIVFIRYEAGKGQTLAELWQVGTPGERLQRLARVVEALPDWWRGTGKAALPMPADIVLTESGEAVLLAAPFHRPSDPGAVFACPERARYLSPERLRATSVPTEDADDFYTIGAMLMGILYRVPVVDAEDALLRTATRTFYAAEGMESALPAWMERVDAIREARAQALRLVASSPAERFRLDPLELAGRVANWAKNSNPIDAVEALRRRGNGKEALELLRDILTHHESYDLLLEAARIATDLHATLEGLEYLERAIALRPDRTDAHALQLGLFTRMLDNPIATANQRTLHVDLLERLDAIVWRDFGVLGSDAQTVFEPILSRFLITRSLFREATNFIFPRLRDRHGTHMWWKFDLSLDYAEALMGLKAWNEAGSSLTASRLGLQRVRKSQVLSEPDLQRYAKRLGALERRLAFLKTSSGEGAS